MEVIAFKLDRTYSSITKATIYCRSAYNNSGQAQNSHGSVKSSKQRSLRAIWFTNLGNL